MPRLRPIPNKAPPVKDDRQRAIADLIAEQVKHGASKKDIAALVKLLRDDQESEATDKIPEDIERKSK